MTSLVLRRCVSPDAFSAGFGNFSAAARQPSYFEQHPEALDKVEALILAKHEIKRGAGVTTAIPQNGASTDRLKRSRSSDPGCAPSPRTEGGPRRLTEPDRALAPGRAN